MVSGPVNLVQPVRLVEIVAGLAMYDEAGLFLGVSMGPPVDGMVEIIDETLGEPVKREVPWRDTRIGNRIPS